ncbi:MAG TPA: DUF1538 domain-containing protein [Candidatus Cloacimonetes bacterium]|nr:DUF1538 domain-containing protein [Candidatus Cloacimonadota bacterium]
MKRKNAKGQEFKVSSAEAFRWILRYVKQKLAEQFKVVAGIILYLIFFQILVLGTPILDAGIIGIGIVMVIFGLTLFLEGLLLGIMPMGEEVGIQLPQKAKSRTILIVALFLGIAATFAEPALGVLKTAGSSVQAWRAPLLYVFLNKHSALLVAAIAIGVGLSMLLSMVRFIKGWSLKPFLYVILPTMMLFSILSLFHPNLRNLLGLAWDSGSVTTGPVTVPLVLALGIGFSHVASQGSDSSDGGFGVVTLASLIPMLIVLSMGFALSFKVPLPTGDVEFFSPENPKSEYVFRDRGEMVDYAISNASLPAQLTLFDGQMQGLFDYVREIAQDDDRIREVFGSKAGFGEWIYHFGSEDFKEEFAHIIADDAEQGKNGAMSGFNFWEYLWRNFVSAIRAIVPLTIFLLALLYFVLREKLRRADEIFLGLTFAIIGMTLFGGGIELGLAKMGDQVGSNLPVSFTEMEVPGGTRMIQGFDESLVYQSLTPQGETEEFFFLNENGKPAAIVYEAENHDPVQGVYRYIPKRGPLFGKGKFSMLGIMVVLIFAFIMGYSATLAEPALSAMGITVEDVTVGAFKKTMLIQAVAIGVGVGIILGVSQVIWNIHVFYLLGPIYVALLIVTHFSTEEYVNIGWDSAAVTTGPITVPLVLSMGLGIGGQVGVVEGFGIVSLVSCCTIVSVLSMGLFVNLRRKRLLNVMPESPSEFEAEDVAA